MSKNIPLPGTFYKNFEGNICQIICVAKSCVNKGKEVVYQRMFPPFDIWSEPLESFMRKTDSVNVNIDEYGQKDKFEQIEYNAENTVSDNISDEVLRNALLKGTLDREVVGKIPNSEIAQRGFMELLDADNYHDKYIIFSALKNYLDKRLLNNIAVSLDIVLEDGDKDEQYDSIRRCLQTFERYETNRLR